VYWLNFTQFVEDNTKTYLQRIDKSERKKIGQFFTPALIAQFMGNQVKSVEETVWILDAGAGSGILTAALLDMIAGLPHVKTINVDLYENNESILPLLNDNMNKLKAEIENIGKNLTFTICNNNFILDNELVWSGLVQNPKKYDIVISNPPYKKINKDSPEASVMGSIVYGQPNLYFLFMAMGVQLLKDNGQIIYIVPRSFTSGYYFTAFRRWFFDKVKISNLHLFISRDSIFSCDSILQETIILAAVKTDIQPETITITESEDAGSILLKKEFTIPYSSCVKSDINNFMFIPTSEEDIKILDFINQWHYTLSDIGFIMKTGLVVDFRETEWLRSSPDDDTVPLFWAYNLDKGGMDFPVTVDDKPQFLLKAMQTRRLMMQNKNYIFIKRFTSKEEKKRLQCSLYFSDDFIEFDYISTENHMNFLTKKSGQISKEEMFGLYVILNSSYMDRYFRLLNGSTQVNANEINSIPFPSLNDIISIGRSALMKKDLCENICDKLLEDKYSLQPVYNVI